MKRRNRLTAVLTAGVMSVLCAVPVPAQAYEEVVIDGITYSVNGNTAYVSKCDPTVTNAVIQSTVNGIPVTSINDKIFADCTSLTSATIPSWRFLSNGMFNGCTTLKSVTVTVDDPEYFYQDDAIYRNNCLWRYVHNCGETEYIVSENIDYLGFSAFSEPGALTDLIIMNPECYIPDVGFAISAKITIHGYDDSTAYRYAMINGNNFVSLGKSAAAPTGSTGYAPADLDGNGVINAADAASILLYAAYVGAGGTDDIMTFLAGR